MTPEDREIEDLVRDAEHQSDKALYPHLKAHIFGPYYGDCYAYLTELKLQLRERKFESVKLCADREGTPPDDATPEEEDAFWWKESEIFLNNADVAIFIFLDHVFTRENLPERAKKESSDVDPDYVPEINSSVLLELMYWLRESGDPDRTLIIFEEGIYDKLGSLVSGVAEAEDVDYDVIENESVEEAIDEARQRCMNWAMNELRPELQNRS